MPLVGFQPMTLVFEQAKTVHALHGAAIMIGFVFRVRNHSTLHNKMGRGHAVT
jgi:hypothetical protein